MPLTLSGSNGVSGIDGTVSSPAIQGGDSNTGTFYPAADTVAWATGGTEALRADSSQRLLVGVTSANANGGVLQLKSGITFPATQVAASDVNTLDDYEEGTFSPIVTSGITSPTYTVQNGTYVKVGKVVTFTFQITTSSGTATASILKFGNLPFTPSASASAGSAVCAYANSGVINSTSTNLPTAYVIPSSNEIEFYTTSGAGFVGTSLASTSFDFRIAGLFFV